jgi:hypothetical protein
VSLWSQLDSAFGTAVSEAGADIAGSIDTVLAGIDIRVKTNLGPEFSLGGLAKAPADPSQPPPAPSPTGLLDLVGVKFSARLVDSGGSTLTQIGTPPDTNPVLVAVHVLAIAAGVFFRARGVAATFR